MTIGDFEELAQTIRELHGDQAVAFCIRMACYFETRNPSATEAWLGILNVLLTDKENDPDCKLIG